MAFGPWSNEASASTTFKGAWISDPDDHYGTLIVLPFGGVGRQHSKDRAKTALQFVGRTYPVYDVGDARAESLNVETVLLGDDEGTPVTIRRLRDIVGDSQVVLFRDGRGRKMYAMPTDFVAEDLEQGGYQVSFLLNRVDFDEALPEILDAPVDPDDFQVKNFAVTVDLPSQSVLLDWDDVPNATLYTVYLDGVPVIQTETSLGNYGPLVPGSYSMWARATVAGVEGPPSTTQGFVIEEQAEPDPEIPPPPPPASNVPQSFVAAPHTDVNTVDFSWTAVTGATGYKMYEVRSPNGVTNGTYTGTTATRGSPTPLGNGPFDYWITALGPWGESAASQHQQFTLPYVPGGGGGGTLSTPPVALGLGTADGQLHYNLGMGFTSGHVNITPTELYAWSGTNITALISGNWVYTKIDISGNIVVSLEAPLDGGTTSSSTNYARCEFREQDEDGDGNISFNPTAGLHYQEGFSRIVSLPPLKPGVVFNQGHDAAGDVMMLKTKKSGSKIVVVCDILGVENFVVDPDYKLNELIWSRLEILDSIAKIYYIKGGSKTSTAAKTIDLTGQITTSGWYWKFGSYNQSNRSTDPTGRIITQVHGWKHFHTGWPTPLDPSGAAPAVSAGADASVSAGGTFTRTGTITGTGVTAQGWRLVGAGTSAEAGTAAAALNWGSPMAESDEFNYTGTPDPTKWGLYDGPGHDNNGLRVPARCSVSSGTLKITGLAGSANAGGMSHKLERQYGKWEIRAKSFYTSAPTNQGGLSPSYHPVAIIWSDNQTWPYNGEYDFMENDRVGQAAAGAFIHYPSLNGTNYQESPTDYPVDMREFHNYAIEWTSSFIKLYVDGHLWATYSGGANSTRKAIQAMDNGGHLTLQMDAFVASGLNAGTLEVEWVRLYPVTPVTSNPTLSNTVDLNWTAPTTPGTYTLEFFATNSSGTTTDQVVVTVGGSSTPSLVYPETFDDGTVYSTFGPGQTVVNVSGSSALSTALSSATPGQIITLASGTYTGDFLIANKAGTSANGIVIRAASSLGAVFASGSSLTINNCTNVTVEGLDFPYDQEGDTLTLRGNSQNCRFMRCRVGPSSLTNSSLSGNYVYVGDDVKHFRIGYCTFRNKGTNGNVVRVYGNFDTFVGCKYGRIDHNLIDTVGDEVGNDKECIRYGVSTMSRTDAFSVIERNVIVNSKADPEVISGKMGRVVQRGNTILRCTGGVTIRHGRNCKQQSNYVIDKVTTTGTLGTKSGGSRFYDSSHLIEDNYYEGLASTSGFQRAIIVDTGDTSGTSTNLAGHWQVQAATVQRNVIVNCASGIYVGDNYALAPDSCGILNNDVINSGGAAVTTVEPLIGDSIVTGNTYYASTGAGSYTADGDSIYRKSGRGPKVSYLDTTDVGHAADLTETDRTGVAV